MSLHSQIAKNSAINLSGKMISLILGLISVAIMTRYLGQERFGYYTTVIAFLQFFGILVDFGLTLTTVQMISDPTKDLSKTMNSVMSFRVISAAAFLLLAPIVVWFFPYNLFIKIGVFITVFSFFCTTLLQTMTGVFQQKLKMWEVTIAEIVGRVFLVAGIVLAVIFAKNIYWVFATISLTSLINIILVFYYSKKYITWKWEADMIIWKELVRRSWPIALSISFNLIYLKMDTIILSLIRSQSEVGLYGATYRVVDILTMLPAVYMGIILPVAANYFITNQGEKLRELLQKAFNALMIFAVPIVIGTMVIARPVMTFVAGNAFAISGDILKVLVIASGAIFVTSLSGYAVVAIDKQKKMMWGYLTTAILTLAGYIYFIPIHGYWGAAWMTVFSEVMIMIWTTALVYKSIKFFPSLKIFTKSIPATIIMTLVLYSLRNLHILWLLLIAVVVYFAFLYAFGGIRRDRVRGHIVTLS